MSRYPVARRLAAAQQALADEGVGGLILFPGPNMRYLSGFDEEPMERHLLLVLTPDEAEFLVPQLYETQVRDASPIRPVHVWADGDDPAEAVAAVLGDRSLDGETVLLDDRMWTMFARDVRSALPAASFGLASTVLDALRIRKDDHELAALRRAATLSDEASRAVRALGADAVGMTERGVVDVIERTVAETDADGVSFEPIVAAGPNGAKPHYRHGTRTIEAGEPVVLDFGAAVDGYPGDQTRTIVFDGSPPDTFLAAHEAVSAALEAGIEAVEPGVEAGAVDRAARSVVENHGFGEAFIHRTGHGVGLDLHEPPYIVAGNETVLGPGMVFSVEPGIYLEGEFGVRLEDLVVVTDSGVERLNTSPRGWRPA